VTEPMSWMHRHMCHGGRLAPYCNHYRFAGAIVRKMHLITQDETTNVFTCLTCGLLVGDCMAHDGQHGVAE